MKNRIRELRERARLSQTELAKLLEVDEASISRWEVGKRPLSPATIDQLAKIFKVSSWELLVDRRGLRRLAGQRGAAHDSKAPEAQMRRTAKADASDNHAEKGHDAR